MSKIIYKDGEGFARELDKKDPLGSYRDQFYIQDENTIYLDGNSLGRLPHKTREILKSQVDRQWGERLIRSWNEGVVFIEASPDRTRLLVKVYRDKAAAETPEWGPMEVEYEELIETWVYDLSSGSWSEAQGWFDAGAPDENLRIQWAGPATLAQVGKGRLVLVGLQAPDERRYVIGSP